jgi:hypothetical protein
VPRLYSLATCAAAMPNATTPSSMAALRDADDQAVRLGELVQGHDAAAARGLGEHQDHEQRGRRGQPEEGGEEQRRPSELGPLAGERCPDHHDRSHLLAVGHVGRFRAGQREERPLEAAGALAELAEGDPVAGGEAVQVGRADAGRLDEQRLLGRPRVTVQPACRSSRPAGRGPRRVPAR